MNCAQTPSPVVLQTGQISKKSNYKVAMSTPSENTLVAREACRAGLCGVRYRQRALLLTVGATPRVEGA